MRVAVVANPENRRFTLFSRAAGALGVGVVPIPWSDLAAGHLPPLDGVGSIRVDSPGEDLAVRHALMGLGGDDRRVLATEILGDTAMLDGMARALGGLPALPRWSSTEGLLHLFDKARTHETLARAGVPSTRALGQARDWEAVEATLAVEPRVMAKRRLGSSASGIVALQRAGRRWQAWTTAVLEGERVHNSLRVRRLRDVGAIRELVEHLATDEGLHLERWEPKAAVGGRLFDVRVLCVAGRARHRVVRLAGTGPMTNLHLGRGRGDVDTARGVVGEESWDRAMALAAEAAALWPDCLMVGVDILFRARDKEPLVVEVNAFGDLLPGLVHEGEDPWAAQVRAAKERFA